MVCALGFQVGVAKAQQAPVICEIVEVDVSNGGDFLRVGCYCCEGNDCERDSSDASHQFVGSEKQMRFCSEALLQTSTQLSHPANTELRGTVA